MQVPRSLAVQTCTRKRYKFGYCTTHHYVPPTVRTAPPSARALSLPADVQSHDALLAGGREVVRLLRAIGEVAQRARDALRERGGVDAQVEGDDHVIVVVVVVGVGIGARGAAVRRRRAAATSARRLGRRAITGARRLGRRAADALGARRDRLEEARRVVAPPLLLVVKRCAPYAKRHSEVSEFLITSTSRRATVALSS